MKTGIVFDIQRFALHDGPGIRSVVFLKGCPLRCEWCCNPESIAHAPQLSHNSRLCIGCHACIKQCPENLIKAEGQHPYIDLKKCTTCGKCATTCPTGALRIIGQRVSANEIIPEILKDKPYFDSSGGGLTLSGGEPAYQPELAVELLKLAKENHLHTCVETTGWGSKEIYHALSHYTNIFLFDYKLSTPEQYRRYTGQDNTVILQSLQLLNELKASIILRTVILPGINDHARHFEAIRQLQQKYTNITAIQVMPYHNYAAEKYRSIGQVPPPLYQTPPISENAEKWREQLKQSGCRNVS